MILRIEIRIEGKETHMMQADSAWCILSAAVIAAEAAGYEPGDIRVYSSFGELCGNALESVRIGHILQVPGDEVHVRLGLCEAVMHLKSVSF
ncbi:MAG: hypothetical protein ACI4KE_02785 [Anaerovoracaceae bacterium]